jgi:hypothetical protein
VVAVDWSGRRTREAESIWLAVARQGTVERLESGRTREQVITELSRIAFTATHEAPALIGLDFSFSFPGWFVLERHCSSVEQLWGLAAAQGETWLSENTSPFWGRPGCPRPELPAHFRITEQAVEPVSGIRPKSTFQIGGAGSVGSGSIRGMALLNQLRRAPCAIWPFDPPGPATAFELYPRLWNGPVVKSNSDSRATYLDALAHSAARQPIDQSFLASATGSEDAFDALVSALTISEMLVAHGGEIADTLLRPPQPPPDIAPEAFASILAIEGWIPGPPTIPSPEAPHIS